MTEGRRADEEMVAESKPPTGYYPILSTSPFGWGNGPIFEIEEGDSWKRGFRVLERHTNVAGMCHGGMLMTFADILLSRAMLDLGYEAFVTVRLTTDFLKPVQLGEWVWGTSTGHDTGGGIVALEGLMQTEAGTVGSCSGLFKAFR